MIKISEFRDKLQQIVRPNRFLVSITAPISNSTSDLRFFVQDAQIPARNQDAVNMKFHGMEYNLMGDSSHEDLTIKFINDYDWVGRDFFEEWMEFNQNLRNDNARVPSTYVNNSCSITVTQIGNTEDDVLAEYQYFDVFPKRVGEIELSMESENTAEYFTVTFAYSYWIQL